MRSLGLVSALFLCAAGAFGQTAAGTITGTVSDPAGAVVANVPMELTNSQTGVLVQSATSDTGNFTFPQLPVGTYTVRVNAPGFKTYVRQNLGVQATQTIRIDVVLEVGTSSESITVTDQASMLSTENAAIASNVSVARLNSLPILGIGVGSASPAGVRNPLASALLTPGVFFNPAQAMRVNGSPANTYGIKLDGQDITNGVNTSASQQQVQPSVEALEEVAIQSSNYSAEFGQAGSGLFQFTTRSGSNSYHGSAYDYFVNEAFNSTQSFSHILNRNRRNDFGGSIGGPISIPKLYSGKDRTFFFFNLEIFKENARIADQTRTVPIQAYREGNFGQALTGRGFCTATAGGTSYVACGAAATFPVVDGLGNAMLEGQVFDPGTERFAPDGSRARVQFPLNQIPLTKFDPSAVKYQALIPAATGPGFINNFLNGFQSKRTTPIPSIKIDHSFNSKMKIGFYKSSTQTETPYATGFGSSEGFPDVLTATRGTYIYSRTWRGNFDYTLTPTMFMHFGVGYIVNDFSDRAPITNFDMVKVLGITGGTVGPDQGARIPVFGASLGQQSRGGMSNTGPGIGQVRNLLQRPTAQLNVTWVKSNHTFKFGGEWRIDGYPNALLTNTSGNFTWNEQQTANSFFQGKALGTLFSGFPYASLLLGRVNGVTIAQPANTRGGRFFWSWFAQDTYKFTRKLTLDYGVRWDIFGYPREQYGRSPSLAPTLANSNAGGHPGATVFEANCNCRFAKNYPFAYAPRLGLAYQIDSKTVARVGFGMSYAMSQGGGQAAATNTSFSTSNYGDPAMILSQGIPKATAWPLLNSNIYPNSPSNITNGPAVVDQNYGRPSRLWQYNVSLQREVMRDLVVEASYIGNRGVWWRATSLVDYNALQPGILKSAYGLDWSNANDRTILSSQINSATAARFRGLIPYTGFPVTQTVAQSLRPFPQFTGLGPIGAPLGNTWYDSLQVKATKRFSHGLDLTWTYTHSKELMLGADNDTGGGVINDVFNRANNKQLSSFSRPNVMVLAANYTLPKWGVNRWVDQAVKDWTVGAVLQYSSGLPIQSPLSPGNNNNLTLLRSTFASRVDGKPLFLQDPNCHCYDPSRTIVLNEAAWTNTPNGQFSPSAAFYNDYRYQRRPSELMSAGRIFRIKEGMTFMIRAEFSNIFNRTLMTVQGSTVATGGFVQPATTAAAAGALGSAYTKDSQGRYISGFGTINTTGTVNGERQGTLVGRFTF
ncbi:MAG: carboxypeptidase-like regulatory domain-containing protein [Acidobacteriota bacterium]